MAHTVSVTTSTATPNARGNHFAGVGAQAVVAVKRADVESTGEPLIHERTHRSSRNESSAAMGPTPAWQCSREYVGAQEAASRTTTVALSSVVSESATARAAVLRGAAVGRPWGIGLHVSDRRRRSAVGQSHMLTGSVAFLLRYRATAPMPRSARTAAARGHRRFPARGDDGTLPGNGLHRDDRDMPRRLARPPEPRDALPAVGSRSGRTTRT